MRLLRPEATWNPHSRRSPGRLPLLRTASPPRKPRWSVSTPERSDGATWPPGPTTWSAPSTRSAPTALCGSRCHGMLGGVLLVLPTARPRRVGGCRGPGGAEGRLRPGGVPSPPESCAPRGPRGVRNGRRPAVPDGGSVGSGRPTPGGAPAPPPPGAVRAGRGRPPGLRYPQVAARRRCTGPAPPARRA